MEKRYSQMSDFELHQELTALTDKARRAEQMGMINELAVYERKIAMAKAYLLNPTDFIEGETYKLLYEEGLFTIRYMNGIFAWGNREGQVTEEAFPISLLGPKVEK